MYLGNHPAHGLRSASIAPRQVQRSGRHQRAIPEGDEKLLEKLGDDDVFYKASSFTSPLL